MTRIRPHIAVLLDENTSGDASRYEASKNYFKAVYAAGGLPLGIPYFVEMVTSVACDFDGLVCVGGRFAYPDDWYVEGEKSRSPPSARLPVERALMLAFLERDKPVLGICAGMQMLGCLSGCRLAPDVKLITAQALDHDRRGSLHEVAIHSGTRLAAIVDASTMEVNTLHREALARTGSGVTVGAAAPDGIIEAIEIASQRFAVGLQWHQEAFAQDAHPGNAVFAAFVHAC
ncbi:MAG: gamma-glutamyl-gamma-aminobutyrate hydrolase family protein [Methylobacteriaceae bacterium]|nr:gamma-glutamyl-gamma-aminobutyrate hydrolase family protein [Methylobacteriaceae bacterium]